MEYPDKNQDKDQDERQEQPVIDIHVPGEAPLGWREILTHLAIITAGLFIALSLEGCVEWRHHRHLVREARENIRSEIEDNRRSIADALKEIHREQRQVQDDLAAFNLLDRSPHAHASVTFIFAGTTLDHASWDTAREIGALQFMPYSEVKEYSELQDEQQEFARHMARLIDAYAPAIAYLDQFKAGTPGASIARSSAEGRRVALAIQSELLLCEAIARSLNDDYAKALSRTH